MIRKIKPFYATVIINTRRPLGLFYHLNRGTYVGIDNSKGHAWTEEFPNLRQCKKWLRDPAMLAPSMERSA
jgi:hypothetical protein